MSPVLQALGMLWASPTSLLGLILAILGGARPYTLRPAGAWWWVGAWGFWAWWYRPGSRWAAITFGNITIASEAYAVDAIVVRHERQHTLQAWVLGPLFLPVYGFMWLVEALTIGAKGAYRQIPLEVAAYDKQNRPDAWG